MPAKRNLKISLASFLLLTSTSVLANDSSWQFNIAPYFWAINLNGRVGLADFSAHTDESFGELMQNFQSGGMLWVDARKESLDLFLNTLFSNLATQKKEDGLTLNASSTLALTSAGASYRMVNHSIGTSGQSFFQLSPYLGARYTINDASIHLKEPSLKYTNNQSWTDPLLGLNLTYLFNAKWSAIVTGDVGGTNLTSDTSYDLQGYLGYQPWKHGTIYLGYRDLYQNYKNGQGAQRFGWQMHLFGPVVGFMLSF